MRKSNYKVESNLEHTYYGSRVLYIRTLSIGIVVAWSYGSWIYSYLCNQCLSPLTLWVRTSIRARCTTLCDKVCQWLVTGRWFSLGNPVSSTDKTDRHDITEILLKVALNTINLNQTYSRTVISLVSLLYFPGLPPQIDLVVMIKRECT